MNEGRIEISVKTLIRAVLVVLFFWLLYEIRNVLVLFFISIILAATLDPIVDWFGKKKIPRSIGVFVIYIVLISVLGLTISLMIPPLVGQSKEFGEKIPEYTQRIHQIFGGIESYANSYGLKFDIETSLKDSFSSLFKSSGEIFSTTVSIFHFFFSAIIVLSLAFYMLVKEEGMKKFIENITPRKNREYVIHFYDRIHNKIGRWVFGQLIVMVSMFLMALTVFSIFEVPFSLIIALIAGFLEIVPYVGPIVSATIATIFGFFISPVTGIIILVSFVIIQQIESHIIVPQVMKKAVGLNPDATILVLLIGAKLGGVMGAILAIPIATAVDILVSDIIDKRN